MRRPIVATGIALLALFLPARPADAATVKDSFEGAVGALAERISEFVKGHPEFQRVSLDPVDGHGHDGAQALFVELARALTKAKIQVVPPPERPDVALLSLRPFLDIRHSTASNSFLTEIGVSTRDLAGKPQGEFEQMFAGAPVAHDSGAGPEAVQTALDQESRVFSTSTESVLASEGVTVSMVGAAKEERVARILEAANARSTSAAVGDEGVCLDGVCVQIVATGPPERRVRVESRNGKPTVLTERGNFEKGDVYFVRVENRNDFQIDVELRIDGINVGAFGRGTRGISYLVRPKGRPGDRIELRTWQDDMRGGRAFRVGSYHESAAQLLGVPPSAPSIGMIQVLVRRAFPKGTAIPPEEQDGHRDKGLDDAATGFGPSTDQPITVEDVALGATRTAIAIRYSGR